MDTTVNSGVEKRHLNLWVTWLFCGRSSSFLQSFVCRNVVEVTEHVDARSSTATDITGAKDIIYTVTIW